MAPSLSAPMSLPLSLSLSQSLSLFLPLPLFPFLSLSPSLSLSLFVHLCLCPCYHISVSISVSISVCPASKTYVYLYAPENVLVGHVNIAHASHVAQPSTRCGRRDEQVAVGLSTQDSLHDLCIQGGHVRHRRRGVLASQATEGEKATVMRRGESSPLATNPSFAQRSSRMATSLLYIFVSTPPVSSCWPCPRSDPIKVGGWLCCIWHFIGRYGIGTERCGAHP